MKEDKMTEQSTPTQEPAQEKAPNLDAVLEGAINQVMEPNETPLEKEEKEQPLPDSPQENVDENNSEESNSEPDDKVAPETDSESTDSTEEPSDDAVVAHVDGEDSKETPLQAPKNWSEDVRSKFKDLPRDAQEYMLKRDKEMTADYTRKTQEIAEQRKNFESLDKVITPMRQHIEATGIGEAEYIHRLLNADMALRNNPKMALKKLAQGYGIDLSSYDSDSADYEADSQIAQLQQQNQTILAELKQFKEQNLMSARQKTENEINAFSTATDDKGNLKHPHFDKVRAKMGNLIDAGEAKSLQDAYAKAVRLDDDLYNQSLEAQRKSAKAEEDAKRKAAVEKAKKVRPRTATAPPSGSVKPSDLDSLLLDSINKAGVSK